MENKSRFFISILVVFGCFSYRVVFSETKPDVFNENTYMYFKCLLDVNADSSPLFEFIDNHIESFHKNTEGAFEVEISGEYTSFKGQKFTLELNDSIAIFRPEWSEKENKRVTILTNTNSYLSYEVLDSFMLDDNLMCSGSKYNVTAAGSSGSKKELVKLKKNETDVEKYRNYVKQKIKYIKPNLDRIYLRGLKEGLINNSYIDLKLFIGIEGKITNIDIMNTNMEDKKKLKRLINRLRLVKLHKKYKNPVEVTYQLRF